MALEHALLVALSEQPSSGLDLAKRFGRSIGFFWHATHQQIYRVLARMDADGCSLSATRSACSRAMGPAWPTYATSCNGGFRHTSWRVPLGGITSST